MPGPSKLLRLASSSAVDVVNLGATQTTILPCEQSALNQGLELLWKRALKEGGHGNHKKKLTVNQDDLKNLQQKSRRDFTRLVKKISYPEGHSGPQLNGPALFYKCANHFYHSETSREFRVELGNRVVHFNAQTTPVAAHHHQPAADCGAPAHSLAASANQHMPDSTPQQQFLNEVMRSLLVACKVAHDSAITPLYVTYEALQSCLRSTRTHWSKRVAIWAGGLHFCDVFYAAVLSLACDGWISGQLMRRSINRLPTPLPAWFQHSLPLMLRLSLGGVAFSGSNAHDHACCNNALSLTMISHLTCCATLNILPFTSEEMKQQLALLPSFVENPNALMPKMWYLQKYQHLLHECTYCMYQARWKKPTCFWVHNFQWEPRPQCGKGGVKCRHLLESNEAKHPDSVSGEEGHTMVEKWSLPIELCVELLDSMRVKQPDATWYEACRL
jgi:hypothetical protein